MTLVMLALTPLLAIAGAALTGMVAKLEALGLKAVRACVLCVCMCMLCVCVCVCAVSACAQ